MKKNNLYFEKNKVWIAEMKYYSKDDNGIEYTNPLSYAFIVDLGDGEFANPFSVSEDFPVFKRVPYSNCTCDGESYGSKVLLVNTIDRTGPCYVLGKKVEDMGFEGDIVSSEKLIDYMFENAQELYFKDRKQFFKERIKRHPITLRKVIESDRENEDKMIAFLIERNAHKRLVK